MADNAGGIRAGRAYVELGADSAQLGKALRDTQAKLRALGSGLTSAGMGLAAAGAAVVGPLLGAVEVFTEMGSAALHASERTGVSVEAISELGYAAQQAGVDAGALEHGLMHLQRTIGEAAGGSKEAEAKLEALGLSVRDLQGLSGDQALARVADQLDRLPEGAARGSAAMGVLGKTGTQLLPLLNRGGAGIRDLMGHARELGLTMSREDAEAAASFGKSLKDLWDVLKMAAFQVGGALAPALKGVVGLIVPLVRQTTDWVKANRELVVGAALVGATLLGTGVALVALGGTISAVVSAAATVGAIGSAAFGLLSAAMTPAVAIGTVLAGVFGLIDLELSPLVVVLGLVAAALGVVGLVMVGVAAALLTFSGEGGRALEWLGGQFDRLGAVATQSLGGIADALAAGDVELAAAVLWAGLKLAWYDGVLFLERAWLGFYDGFAQGMDDLAAAAVKGIVNLVEDMRSAWVQGTGAIEDVWYALMDGITRSFLGFSGVFQKVWARIKGAVKGTSAEAEVNAIADATRKAQEEVGERATDRQVERQRQLHDVEEDRAKRLGAVDAKLGERTAERHHQEAEEEQGFMDARSGAQDELDEATGVAHRAKELNDARMRLKLGGMPDVDDVMAHAKDKVDVQGTFSAAIAGRLGAGKSVADRHLEATVENGRKLDKIKKAVEDGGRFG